MKIVWNRNRFELEGKDTYDVREQIKQFGFKWDPDNKAWHGGEHAQLQRLRTLSLPVTITPDALEQFNIFEGRKSAAISASRATDSNINIPAPEGLQYLPYQKAGIAFMLQVFGDS
jgi:SWI/SNF-related matrix-associated actin-dependent regulator of chromatin subfamily A-like protein 1